MILHTVLQEDILTIAGKYILATVFDFFFLFIVLFEVLHIRSHVYRKACVLYLFVQMYMQDNCSRDGHFTQYMFGFQ